MSKHKPDPFSGLPQRLRSLREQHGLSLDAISNETGVSKAVLGNWERGANAPIMDRKFAQLCSFYGVSADWLLTGHGVPNSRVFQGHAANSLPVRLRALRDELRCTQRELAEDCELSVHKVRFFETGRSEPSMRDLVALSNALNVNIHWLITGHGPRMAPLSQRRPPNGSKVPAPENLNPKSTTSSGPVPQDGSDQASDAPNGGAE